MEEFKASMKKEELLEIAAANGIATDDGMTKTQIIDALNAHNAQEAAGTPTEGAAEGAESAADGEGGGDTTHGEKPAERPGEGEEDTGGSGTDDGGGEQPPEEAAEGAGSDGDGGGGKYRQDSKRFGNPNLYLSKRKWCEYISEHHIDGSDHSCLA